MNKTGLTEDRICTVLKEKLYSMAGNDSKNELKPLELNWVQPVNSTDGMISVLENALFLLGYVQKNQCSKEYIDKIIQDKMKPVLNGLNNEYDFALASVILAICKEKTDFTDEKKMKACEIEVLGRFIESLEYGYKHFTHDVENNVSVSRNNYDEYMDTSSFVIGTVVKNYKEMCRILGQEIKTGKARQLQLKDWERYFEWEKSGQKFIITDVYDTPLTKEDKRRLGNNSVYVKYIELILLQYLSKQKNGTSTLTKRNWWQLLGMVNHKYNRVAKDDLKKVNSIITTFEINNFYLRSNKKLEQILFSALRNLKNQKLILEPEIETVIVDNENNIFTASEMDRKEILRQERYVLKNVMGFEKMSQVFCRFQQDKFYRMVNERISELYGWDHYFKQIKISYNTDNILEAIPQTSIELQRELLNEKIINVLNENASDKFSKDMEKWDRLCDELLIWGDYRDYKCNIHGNKAWKIPDTYIEAQGILVDELIRIGHKNINMNIIQQNFEESNELDQIINSFVNG